MRVARRSVSLLSSHGRGIAPQDALKKVQGIFPTHGLNPGLLPPCSPSAQRFRLELRRPWGFSPEARRGSQGASRARETGLTLRGAGKAGNPFQTTQGNRLSCRDQEGYPNKQNPEE